MEQFGRRRFLAQSAAAMAVMSAAGHAEASDPFAAMTWLNPPASFARQGDQWRVRSKANTDFWRKTFTNTVSDNGHFWHRSVQGRFVFEARITGQYNAQYDQAGLMVRQSPEHWIKCGTEFFEGSRHASVVVTHAFSDWSTFPDLSQTGPVWWRLVREPEAINVFVSADGDRFELVRSAYLAPSDSLDVGLLCCAPSGPGFDAMFDKLKLS